MAAKGLEFDAVHVPGLTKQSFPSSYRGQRCPPPAGMVQGDDDDAESGAEAHGAPGVRARGGR
jgi:hypothetical protein